jgi:hypothetical protein
LSDRSALAGVARVPPLRAAVELHATRSRQPVILLKFARPLLEKRDSRHFTHDEQETTE